MVGPRIQARTLPRVHGFLGPNGAGKSTTLRVLLGLLRIDSGSARLLGGDPWTQAAPLHQRLAYVPGDVNLWPNLTGGEAIDLLCRARNGVDPARRAELLDRFDLDPTTKGRSYSKGNRQKVALVAALASDVELLLLDEPTSGLDPLKEKVFTDIIRERAAQGTTVLLSSHILSEVESLCDHVSIIRDGRIVDSGTLDQLRHLRRNQVHAEVSEQQARALDGLPGVHDATTDRGVWSAQVDTAAMATLLATLADFRTTSVTITPPTLEELFLSHYDSAESS
ncbi:MAG: ABC transporter ATP-binding protein [Micrococcales bacterium]|nr:MAG: ABC transporter ATP-binding protein [Micrococcales bacterium]